MLRFRLFSIPVNVHLSHLLICGLIGSSFLGWKARTAWPRVPLTELNHPNHTATVVLVTAAWAVLVMFSVLVHELGHALTMRAFGGSPQVHLVGLGGRTVMERTAPLQWTEEVLITLAGPGAGLLLGVLCGGLVLLGSRLPDPVAYFALGLCVANLGWTVLNLLPITGLDGGVITTIVLTRIFGRTGFLLAQLLALGLAAAVLLWGLATGQPLLAVLVGLMAVRTLANIAAWQRGEAPGGSTPHPLEEVIERAEALYRERKLREAQLIAAGIAEAVEAPALLRSRAHVLLGWIALKEGSGRRALDHFAQVQGLEVPPHALAAGFSLIGDELRAIPLWALAAQQAPNDAVIRHEWAGALIRGGHETSARQIPGVDLVRAFSAAERVHYVRKEFEAAARAAEAGFREAPHPTLAYTAACAWAQAGKLEDAMRMLTLAAQRGYRDAAAALEDPDLRPLRARPEFVAWLTGLKAEPHSPPS